MLGSIGVAGAPAARTDGSPSGADVVPSVFGAADDGAATAGTELVGSHRRYSRTSRNPTLRGSRVHNYDKPSRPTLTAPAGGPDMQLVAQVGQPWIGTTRQSCGRRTA